MLLKYLGSVVEAHECENRVAGIAWSPNNLKLAVGSSDRYIYLFDENCVKRDRFSTKPADPKYGKKSYVIKGIAFSPDSTKIAVGQTDCIVYVYKIGEQWGEKKVICNKFRQNAPVTCLVWPSEGPIIVGLADGKVRAAFTKSQKSQTLYTSDTPTIALAVNVRGTGFLSSHSDGSIVKYYLSPDGVHESSGRVCVHPCPAFALAWPRSHILAAGDKRLTFYDSNGKVLKNFDYTKEYERKSDYSKDDKGRAANLIDLEKQENTEGTGLDSEKDAKDRQNYTSCMKDSDKEFTIACCSPSGQSVAVGSWNRIRVFDYSPRRSVWEESVMKPLPNFYTVTAMSWRKDGSKLAIGGLCGAVEVFETTLKKILVRGTHEVVFVGPSQAVIKSLQNDSRPVIIKSQGSEIEDVKVLGRTDSNVVARTANSLLIGDIESNLISEIAWEKGGNEKFFFDFPGVCLIFSSGELTIVEYGRNEPLGSVRTEAVNPHVVSVRINERHSLGMPDNKRLAYLLDPRTVRIVDFVTSQTVAMISFDVRIDWLELNETGHRLLARDKRARLWLSNDRGNRSLLMTNVSFASWVPESDVAVAQSGNTLAIWYNVDAPEVASLIPIKGDAIDVIRENGQTAVNVEEMGCKVAYLLDEALIEFGTALHDNDFGRVLLFLEELGDRPQAEAMWENVARNAMSARQLQIAARCYAALGDVACSKFLKDIVAIGEKYSRETGNEPLSSPDCWAKLAILNGELKTAEAIYLEQNELEEALEMYKKYWRWEEALQLAESRHWAGLKEFREKHLTWLLDSGQAARAAAILENIEPRKAVRLNLEAQKPGRAARLLLANEDLLQDEILVMEVVNALRSMDLMELAGEILEKISEYLDAIKCYAEAGVFARALELARTVDPNSVVDLEREWGKHLSASGHFDAAINHFIEAGETALALNAAINAKQWRKALQIIQVIEDDDDTGIREQCEKLAEYFASVAEKDLAETLFLRSGNPRRAVETHIKYENWSRAHEVAVEHMSPEESKEVLVKHAQALEQSGDPRHAEELYIAIGEYDLAIAMYRKLGQRRDMVRLVAKYRPDLLETTHAHLARELEAAGKHREAEEHFVAAGEWKAAVAAYRAKNLWEDALRVAKVHSGDVAAQQVALMWARTLAPELAARLLNRLSYLPQCLQLACDSNLFPWALEIAKYGTPEQKKEVHYKYAMALEDEGKFQEAEREFINADRAMEAIKMYIHNEDWEAAEAVAKEHSEQAVSEVLIAKAAAAARKQDYATAEALLLRAHKPEIIIEHYKEAGMWSEALRVCREYLPSQEASLRRELGQKGSEGDALEEARKWLEVGEIRAALDILILDPHAPRSSLIKAADILLHQADAETIEEVGGDLGERLFAAGEHALAAQVFLQADRLKDAIDALVSIGEWDRARRIARELAPDVEPYLEEKYRKAQRSQRDADSNEGSLEALAKKGQWNKLFELASENPEALNKFVTQRAVELLKSRSPVEALELYVKFGAHPVKQHFNLYFRLSEDVLNLDKPEYRNLAMLRTFLFDLMNNLQSDEERFERLLESAHYFAVKVACAEFSSLSGLVFKCSVSLLRFTDILLADRAYLDAGLAARSAGLTSEAFVFLNHFLDLEECIEDEEGNVDVEDLRNTDFPLEVPLPEKVGAEPEVREEIREWILAVSMDQRVEQALPMDHRGVYVGSLSSADSSSPPLQPCALTGYPIRGPTLRFEKGNRVADREDWSRLINTAKQAPSQSPLNDILAFVQEWCGPAMSYTF